MTKKTEILTINDWFAANIAVMEASRRANPIEYNVKGRRKPLTVLEWTPSLQLISWKLERDLPSEMIYGFEGRVFKINDLDVKSCNQQRNVSLHAISLWSIQAFAQIKKHMTEIKNLPPTEASSLVFPIQIQKIIQTPPLPVEADTPPKWVTGSHGMLPGELSYWDDGVGATKPLGTSCIVRAGINYGKGHQWLKQ